MNILIVNDDGIKAPGLRLLAALMKQFGTVRVVAPHTEQSAIGHGITIFQPIRLHQQPDFMDGVQAWSIEAKPADCVKFALNGLELPADLVVSGINNGPNLGTDIIYSGTLGGASEAIICGVPAIAVSTDAEHWQLPEQELGPLFELILDKKLLSADHVLNVNFPSRRYQASKGVRVTEMGVRPYINRFELAGEPDLYWARGEYDQITSPAGTDIKAYEDGYTSVTPIQINRTVFSRLEAFRAALDRDFR